MAKAEKLEVDVGYRMEDRKYIENFKKEYKWHILINNSINASMT